MNLFCGIRCVRRQEQRGSPESRWSRLGPSGVVPPALMRTSEKSMTRTLMLLARQEDGQDLIEYGLLAALISIIAVLAITSVGSQLQTSYQNISASIP